ncbi:GLPGLI family protein [Winogradskyella sp.]|uniref:GLPGLI family protein n=1 Tax=Winogradskyella sp. TaxID=1883156 RepID=UPI00345ABAFC
MLNLGMKHILVILSFLNCMNLISQSTGKVTYKVSIVKDSTDLPNTNPEKTEIQNDVLAMIHGSQDVESYLVFNDSIALYTVEPKTELPIWNNDNDVITTERAKINLAWIFAGGESLFYSDLSRNWNISQQEVFGVTKRVKRDSIKWEITTETKEILGYKCIKANLVEDSNSEVWYTSQIPVEHGPHGYNGLPGLILEVKFGKMVYFKAQSVDFENTEYLDIEEPVSGEIVTSEDYRKLGQIYLYDD